MSMINLVLYGASYPDTIKIINKINENQSITKFTVGRILCPTKPHDPRTFDDRLFQFLLYNNYFGDCCVNFYRNIRLDWRR